jgi:hypothetical protein
MSSRINDARSNRECYDIVHRRIELQNQVFDERSNSIQGEILRTKLNLTRRKTVWARSYKTNKLLRLEETKMKDALEMAISLPLPIATPMSAAVSA